MRASVGMIRLPLLDPGLNPVYVGLHLRRAVAGELNHDFLIKRFTRLLQQHLHNLRIYVLLKLGLCVISAYLLSAGQCND